MIKKAFKSQASSSRAVSGAFGQADTPSSIGGFGSTSAFGVIPSSSLSYVYEPPDLSNISEPNVVVALKNLQKKDSITKTKALEDLQAYVLTLAVEDGGVEDAILEAWIKIYPRTSIDSARRARQLAHQLQGQISVSCGKRIAKYMPSIVGSWLAGLYDNDRAVTRTARESLRHVFTSEEKLKSLWRIYQSSILGYAEDAVLKETVYTLSDERTISPDDASAKYARVAGAAILMVANVIEEKTNVEDKNEARIDEFLGKEKLWKFASNADPYLRLAVYTLATTVFAKPRDSLDLRVISDNMLMSSLNISQVGSAFKYATALALLTAKSPSIWTQYYNGSGKKSAARRLCQFLRRGSQGGPPEYWAQIKSLIQHLPPSILLPENEAEVDIEKALEPDSPLEYPVLEALRGGLTSREEPKDNHPAAWNTYLDFCHFLMTLLSGQRRRDHLAKNFIAPIIFQYVLALPDNIEWTVLGPHQHLISLRALVQVLHASQVVFREEWYRLSSKIIENFQKSLPEQSKDYKKSQDSVSAEIGRWYRLQAIILGDQQSDLLHSTISSTLESEIKASTSTLRERNGKAYSAAAILLYTTELLPELVRACGAAKKVLIEFAREEIPKLLLSPSAPQLITTLGRLDDITDVRYIYEAGINDLRDAPESTAKSAALKGFISSPFLAQSAKVAALDIIVKESLDMAKHGDESRWDLVMAALGNRYAPSDLTDYILVDMTYGLSTEEDRFACLEGLQLTIKQNSRVMKAFAQSSNGSSLLSKLLFLTESPDITVREKAHNLSDAIEAILSDEKGSGHAMESMIEIINQGIDTAVNDSLSIDALVEQAQKLLHQNSEHNMPALAAALLPNETQWTKASRILLLQEPNPSMSIMEPLAGAMHLIQPTSWKLEPIARDLDGYSPLLRMAWYVTKLINTTKIFDHTTDEERAIIFQFLALTSQLARHNLSVLGSVPLWESKDPDLESEIARFVSDIQNLQIDWMQDKQACSNGFVSAARNSLLEDSRTPSASSYHSASAYVCTGFELMGLHEISTSEERANGLDTMSLYGDILIKSAILATYRNPKVLSRYCNKLVDDLTRHNWEDPEGLLRHLVPLNCIIDIHENIFIAKIPAQRLIFLVKHLISQYSFRLPSTNISIHVLMEIKKVLISVLAPLREIYGVFWQQLIDIVLQVWSRSDPADDQQVPPLFTSLRLFEQLRTLNSQESNDDLHDAWAESRASLEPGLLKMLVDLQDIPVVSHKPRRMLNELLSDQLRELTDKSKIQAADLYPVLASESLALQLSAYEILHQNIPKAQEQISLDKALSKDFVSKLPEELLSLILAAPNLESLAEIPVGSDMHAAVETYLLSWKLVYDHWTNSSSVLKADYAASLKDGTYLQCLLDFAFDILINKRSKPVAASQFEVESFNPETTSMVGENTHKLLIHLYYLSLKYLPTLSKAWWRDITSRQKAIAVETWTEKYISPQIIASELNAVSKWAPSQATSDQPVIIKVSSSTREITASIPIDEQFMQIVIQLPPSYPLSRATVDSVHRVAVDEKKWHSWLMTTQGVINFSGVGDDCVLIDGLMAWSKNVSATLKGQTECAICYSVVGADRQLPGKRCGTCRNLFHGSCLFRWFKSSNSSSCPLCRNRFNYI